MRAKNKGIVENYLRYKDASLAYYNNILDENEVHSVALLIKTLKDLENKHKNEILTNGKIGPSEVNFSDVLALTPTHELGSLSRIFEDIISFKESSSEPLFKQLGVHGRYGSNEIRGLIASIKKAESNLNTSLRIEKDKYKL